MIHPKSSSKNWYPGLRNPSVISKSFTSCSMCDKFLYSILWHFFLHIYDMNFMLSGYSYNTVFWISKLEIANSSQILLWLYVKCTLFDNITAATFSLFWSEWSYKRNTRMRWCRRHSRCRYQLQRSFDPHNQQLIPAASVIKSLSKLCPDSLFSYIFRCSWWWWRRCYKDCTLSPQITDEI